MSNYPAGVTNATIDALYESEEDEQRREAVESWLQFDKGWWRRYMAGADLFRRMALLDARLDGDGPKVTVEAWEVGEYAENLRDDLVRWATSTAHANILRARRERSAS